MTTPEHSPTPFRYMDDIKRIYAGNDWAVADLQPCDPDIDIDATGRFIVRAVNAHEALVAALHTSRDMLAGLSEIGGVSTSGLLLQCDAALALAKGA